MPPVTVLILAPQLAADAGPLERRLDDARTALADHHRHAFLEAGADGVVVRREPPDDTPFGARLRRLVGELRPAGLVVLGAGSVPMATRADLGEFVVAAAAARPGALANHRHSADIIAIAGTADALRELPPDLTSDNALPRWLAEVAGIPVRDLRARRHLAMDVDSPLDLLLLEGRHGAPILPLPDDAEAGRVRDRLARLRALAQDPGAELLVAGRTSAADLRWLERSTRSRTRALIEERGLRTADVGASVGRPNRRPPRSLIGAMLERDGPESLGRHVAALCDGALLDSRVLMAHRLGGTSAAGRPPRTASRATSCSPAGSATRGCPTSPPRPPRRRSPSCSVATASSVPGSASRWAAGAWPGFEARIVAVDPVDTATAAAGYHREALPDPEAVGEDTVLADAIRAEIAERGPITFARFMDRALYEPGHGYYRRPEPGPGTSGADFLTAPEAHPIFGAAIGLLLEQAWDVLGRPSTFSVTEHGAGTGALAAGLLGALRDLASPLYEAIRYRPVEVEAARIDALRERLAADGLAGSLAVAGGRDTVAGVGAIVANEVLDALPVHRVVGRDGGLRELLVTLDPEGRFAWLEAEPSTPALAERLAAEGVALGDGQVTEVCLALDPWLEDTTRHLARGLLVIVDYAAEPAALHGATHPDGTLRAFARHAVGSDPFRHVGRQDLTATVDLAAVRSAASGAGLTPIGETTQAELLSRVGTADLTAAYLRRPGATLQEALALRSAVARLMDTRGMGGFRVLAYGRGLPGDIALPALERFARPGS